MTPEAHPLCKVSACCSHFPIDLSATSLERSRGMRALSSALSKHFIPLQKGRKLSGDRLINSVFSAVQNSDIYNLFWKENKYNLILLNTSPHPLPKFGNTLFYSDDTSDVSVRLTLCTYLYSVLAPFKDSSDKNNIYIEKKKTHSISQQELQTRRQCFCKLLF